MQKIIEIVTDVLGVPVAENTAREDVAEWDSVKMLQIMMSLDEAGLPIPLEKIAEVRSVADLIRFAGRNVPGADQSHA